MAATASRGRTALAEAGLSAVLGALILGVALLGLQLLASATPGGEVARAPAATGPGYACVRSGVRVTADRPCAPGDPARVASAAPPPAAAAPVPAPDAAPRCAEIDDETHDLEAAGRMSQGAFRADELRHEWRVLRDEARALHCPGR